MKTAILMNQKRLFVGLLILHLGVAVLFGSAAILGQKAR